MKKFRVRYVRTVYESYEIEVEADSEYDIQDLISEGKYGEEIDGERFIDSYSDEINITEIEEING